MSNILWMTESMSEGSSDMAQVSVPSRREGS